jgi:hypothetical protein
VLRDIWEQLVHRELQELQVLRVLLDRLVLLEHREFREQLVLKGLLVNSCVN